MAHCGYVTKIKNLRPHGNADRLVLGTCFDNTVCVSKDQYVEGEIGVYFETDLQLSMEFCEKNGLIAVYENGVNVSGGYMDASKRNVRAIKLRGEQSDGLFLPLSCLEYTGVDMDTLNVGDQITVVNGHDICKKYIPRRNPARSHGGPAAAGKKKKKVATAPLFFEHIDTEQLQYNLGAFKSGDLIEITRKLHGTSARTAHTKVFKGYKRSLLDRLLGREGTPIYDWGYISGTRRTVLDNFDGGFYGSNEFREPYHDFFSGKLWKGETVYYEIVGFTHTGAPIMSTCDNKKLKDKEFLKMYGDTTVFSYGCEPNGKKTMYGRDDEGNQCSMDIDVPQSRIFVYRMTMTNEDGEVIEYTPDFMRYRCERMGVETVPVEWYGFIPDEEIFTGTSCEFTDPGEFVLEKAKEFYDGPELLANNKHIREGVVVRILNRPNFAAYKCKNFSFKVLEGLIKDLAQEPDMEEAEEDLSES